MRVFGAGLRGSGGQAGRAVARCPHARTLRWGRIPVQMKFVALIVCLAQPSYAQDDVIIPFPEVRFVEEAPDQPQRLGPLWGVRSEGAAGTYLKVPAGFEAPLHSHTADYRAIVVKGTWSHWVPGGGGEAQGKPLPVGSYWTQRADEPHKDACISAEECIILLINDNPYQTVLEQ